MMTSNCCIYLTKDWFLAGGSIVICPFWPITWARNYEVSLWFGCWRVCLSSLHAARRPCQHAPSIQVKHTHGWLAAEDAASRCWAGWRIRDRLLVLRLAPGQDWGWMEPMFNKQDSYSSEGDEKGWEDRRVVRFCVCVSNSNVNMKGDLKWIRWGMRGWLHHGSEVLCLRNKDKNEVDAFCWPAKVTLEKYLDKKL